MDWSEYVRVPCPDGKDNCAVIHHRKKDDLLKLQVDEKISQIPAYARDNKTVRTDIADNSEETYGRDSTWHPKPIEEANLITSLALDGPAGRFHTPILDIDFEAALVPSSTPGHYHLYMDRVLGETAYMKLLEALAEAGIIQYGFLDNAKQHRASSARLPWVKKGDKRANSADPDKEQRELREKVKALRAELALLEDKLETPIIEEVVW